MKKISLFLGAVFLILQCFQIEKQSSLQTNDAQTIQTVLPMSENVHNIIKLACYDCHSNSVSYPWYSYIQPVGWWLQHHVDEGRHELNFQEFATYSYKKKKHKLEEIAEVVSEKEMPMPTYTWTHPEARLSDAQRDSISIWAKQSILLLKQDTAQ